MKKVYLIILSVLVLLQPALAGVVRPDAAARYAQGILGMKQSPVLENTRSLRAPGRDSQSADPEYYIFNNPDGGWAIIAADDRVNPVIGYSYEGSFSISDMPDNLQWWMDGVADVIDAVRQSANEAPESVSAAWESLRDGRAPVINGNSKYLPTAEWGQTPPYNNLCPVVSGETSHAATGCVATSMAIIMRYNCWPAHGVGVIGGYTTETKKTYILPYDLADNAYDWDNMPLTNGSSIKANWTDQQKREVAQLMLDCGVAVEMDYTADASAAASGKMLNAMKENMLYSQKAALVSRSSYKRDEWFALIKNEIDNGRVVYYAGDSDAGGHAFVCDGYEADANSPKIRINWGWNGFCNGFYTLDLSVSQYDFAFSDMQEAVIGLAPNTAQVDIDETIGLVCINHNGFYGIEPLTPADITAGSEMNFYVGWFMNNDNRDITAEFKVCLEDKDGNIKQEGWNLKIKIPAADGYVYCDETQKTVLNVSPELTDHFRLYIKNSKGKWEPMRGNYDILPDVDGIICGVIQDPVIVIPDDCTAGQEIDLSLSLGFTHVKTVKWSVNGTALKGSKVTLVKGQNAIRADVEYLDDTKGSVFSTLQVE